MLASSNILRFALGAAWLLAGAALAILWLIDTPSIEITWQTETEYETAGFNLLRSQSESGPYAKINERLIPASDDAAAGAGYSFRDSDVAADQLYYYQLEDVDFAGNVTAHEAVTFEARGKAHWLLALAAISLLAAGALIIQGWRGRQNTT
jgi:hypothetical protein